MYRIIGDDGKEYGPASADQIRQWIALGRCAGRTLVQPDGSRDWKPVAEFPEFSQSLAAFATMATLAVPLNAQPRTSGLAIASLVCGVAGLVICVTAPIGLVLGLIARKQIKQSQGRLDGSGYATAGIAISSVMVAVFCVGIVAGIFVPALAQARQKARSIRCQVQLKQLALAVRMYATEHNGRFPPAVTWCDAVSNRVSSISIFHCPAQSGTDCSYAFNQKLDGKTLDQANPQTVLLFESDAGWNGAGGDDLLVSRKHSTSRNNTRAYPAREEVFYVTFVDGSFAAIPASGLPALRWEP